MLDQKPKIVDMWKHLDNVSPAGPVHKYPGIVHLGINFDLSSLTNHSIDIWFSNSDGSSVFSLIQFEIWEHHIGSSHLHWQLRNCVQFKRWLLVAWTSQNFRIFSDVDNIDDNDNVNDNEIFLPVDEVVSMRNVPAPLEFGLCKTMHRWNVCDKFPCNFPCHQVIGHDISSGASNCAFH